MIRKIVNIDEKKCNGCMACVNACHEGAIAMVNGKARLIKDDYCDGLGDCLPACPVGAINIIEREAADYDEEAVQERMKLMKKQQDNHVCPGSMARSINQKESVSMLSQWPVQIKLIPVNAEYFENANILIAADCTAYAYAKFHEEFIKNNITLIGCPKLDAIDYSKKLTEIIKNNNIKSIKVARMEVPCCMGIVQAVTNAIENSGKIIPYEVVTISCEGKIIN